jgi:hypothetical protein
MNRKEKQAVPMVEVRCRIINRGNRHRGGPAIGAHQPLPRSDTLRA